MSTVTVTRAPALLSGPSLRTLAWHEVRRYARHPLFLIALALLVPTMVSEARRSELDGTLPEIAFYPIFWLGLFGTIVGYRLAKSMDAASEAADAAPVPRSTRTAALCLATLLPGAVAAVIFAATALALFLRLSDQPVFNSGMTGLTTLCISLSGAVACSGGPLFGIMVARWTSFPGAGLLAAVFLVAWTLVGGLGDHTAEPSRTAALITMLSPDAQWFAAEAQGSPIWQVEGSPLAHLLYVITLCLIGATLAIVRDAEGQQRKQLWRVFGVLVLVAVAVLGLATLAEPVRTTLNLTA